MSFIKRARSRAKNRLGVDVGPFLNVIVCVIGVLVLLVCGLVAVGSDQVGSNPDWLRQRIAMAEQILALRQDAQALAAALEKLTLALNDEEALRTQYAKADDDLKRALDQAKDPQFMARVQLAKQVAELETRKSQLQKLLKDLASQIAQAKENASDQQKYVSIPASKNDVKAVYVECHAAGITIYRKVAGDIRTTKIELANLQTAAELKSLIDEVAKGHGQVVLNILVRPGGVKAYDKIIGNVRRAEAPYASVPISVQGILRFR